ALPISPEDTATSGNLITDDDNGTAPGGVDSDIDGDSLRVTQINGQNLAFDPASGEATVNLEHGVLTVKADGTFTFVPAADYKGTQDFTYTVSDPDGLTDSAAVNITVDSVNDPPIANPDPIVIDEDVTSTFDPRANDIDIDTPHDQLVITSLNGQAVDTAHPENYVPTDVYDPSGRLAGQVGMTADGQVKFDPAPDYNNDPTNLPVIPYTISDGQGGFDSSTITIQVRPVNDPPVALDDTANVAEDGPAATGNVLANDIDVDGDDLDVVGFVNGNADDGHLETPDTDGSITGTYGTLTWDAESGEYKYTLDNSNKTVQKLGPSQTLTETFTYEVSDGKGGTDTATLTVTVHGTDDPVVITGIGAAGGDQTIYENDLPAGSSPDAGGLSKSGSFTIEALDGIQSVEVGGTTLTAAQLTATSTYPVTIETDHGTLVLTGYTGDDQGGTVGYTYTLKTNVDNDSEPGADTDHYVEQVAVTVTDADGDAKSSSVNVNIVDDAPFCAGQTIEHSPQANTNLMFIIDRAPNDDTVYNPNGPGMDDTGQFSGNPEWTRLHAAIVAMQELIDRYDGMGEVRVYIVAFNSQGERIGGAWMTAAEAHAFADQMERYLVSDGNPGGNYDAALAAAMEAYADPNDGKLADAQNVTYFMSDGVPRAGDGNGDSADLENQYAMATDQYVIHPDYGQADFGIQPAEQAAWEQFLRDNNINAYAVGMGGDVQPGELDPIAYDGRTGTDTTAVIVDDGSDFQTQLVAGSDFTHHGNLLDGGGHYGADGGYIKSIAYGGDTFTFDGSQVTRTGNGSTTYTYDAATHRLTLTTANNGVLTVNMVSGEYDYVQHGQPSLHDETFTYTLSDNDGDTASSDLNFKFTPTGAGTPAPNDDTVIIADFLHGGSAIAPDVVIRDEWLLWNDTDPQGDPLSIDQVGGVINSKTEYYTPIVGHDDAKDVVTYTWQTDEDFDNYFYYSATDGQNTDTARVNLERGDGVLHNSMFYDTEPYYVETTGDDNGTIIIGYDYNDQDHPGLVNVIHAQGGNDVVAGSAGNDILYGDAGHDWLVGGGGNDTLYGGTGNDLLEGGAGADTFVWTLADRGTAGSPAHDGIRDFNVAEGDRMDLRDLLVNEHGDAGDIGNLDRYIDIASDGAGNTVIRVSSTGGFTDGNYAAGAEDQRITLKDTDLYAQYGVSYGNDAELIGKMMQQGQLVTN
ncbi:MAG: tandem-95 repeat protein, partial [Thiobacillus sp.]|nr:tandem-95 repeat protein [Thiobacillus sp.]